MLGLRFHIEKTENRTYTGNLHNNYGPSFFDFFAKINSENNVEITVIFAPSKTKVDNDIISIEEFLQRSNLRHKVTKVNGKLLL